MATLESHGHWTTFDQPESTLYRDFSDILEPVLRVDPSFLSMVSIGRPTRSIKYEWGKDDSPVRYVTATNDAAGALAANETSFTVVPASRAYIKPGMVLRDTAPHKVTRDDGPDGYELLFVRQVDSNGTVHVVRDYGHDTTGYTLPAHAAGARYRIVYALVPDKSGAQMNRWTGSGLEYNVCQTFRYDLSVSGAALEQEFYGTRSQTLADQIMQRTKDLKEDLGYAMLYGIKHLSEELGADDDGSGNPAYRSMDGIFTMIQRGGNTDLIVDTPTTFTPNLINDLCKRIQLNGGLKSNRAICLLSYDMAEVPYTWDQDKVRLDPNMTSRGGYVTSFMTKLGIKVDFIKDIQVFGTDLAIIDPQYMPVLHPFGRRAWFSFGYNTGEDGKNAAILGDWTVEFHRADKCHAIATQVSIP